MLFSVSLFCLTMAACSGSHHPPPDFEGDRALSYISRQVAFGPRVPGTEASRQCRTFLYQFFRDRGMYVDSQKVSFTDPYSGVDTPLVNIRVRFTGDRSGARAILLVAHYDSRPRADRAFDTTRQSEPIAGANDGASGVAVLMELANLLHKAPPPVNVEMLLVDGEDWGKEGDYDYYLLGSRRFAAAGIHARYRFGIVLDMVGDSSQAIYREEYSERFFKPLNDMIWKAAADLGVATFNDSVKRAIIDDHLPLAAAGVPTVVVIDLNYPYWHTEHDTPDKCSAQSLANVGSVIARILYNPSLWPSRNS